MALFGKKKRGLIIDDPMVALAVDQAAGTAFGRALQRGEVPPRAFLWINRYVNQVPDPSSVEVVGAADGLRARAVLIALLRDITTTGGTIPVIAAAENSVTETLRAEALRLAKTLDSDEAVVRGACELIRLELHSVEVGLTLRAIGREEVANTRPDLMVEFFFGELDRVVGEMRNDD